MLWVGGTEWKLRETRFRWFGYVAWRNDGYVRQRTRRTVATARGRERQRRRWVDCMRDDTGWQM